MRAAYVVLSHRDPGQVERLVGGILRLSPQASVLVRHDARAAAPPRFDSPRVHVEAHADAADWGSWDLLLAALRAVRHAVELFDPDLVVLVSGQDYPARNLARWEEEFVLGGGGWVCAGVRELHYRPRWGRPYGEGDDELTRYTYRWHALPAGRWLQHSASRPAALARWALGRLGHWLEPAVDVRSVTRGRGYHVGLRALRTPFGDGACHLGSQWFASDREGLDRIVDALAHDRGLRRAYRRSIIPDESFVPTVLARWRPPRPGAGVSYVVWEPERDAPRTLTAADLEAVLASGAPFCRKLAPGVSDTLADDLDRLAPER